MRRNDARRLVIDSTAPHWARDMATQLGGILTDVTGIASTTSNALGSLTTVAALPAASTQFAGSRSVVTDATATTFASIVAAGGANVVPVYCDGTHWRIG